MERHEAIPRLLTKSDVAGVLSLSVRAVERLIAAGKLAKVKIGRTARVPESSLRAFLDHHTRKAGA